MVKQSISSLNQSIPIVVIVSYVFHTHLIRSLHERIFLELSTEWTNHHSQLQPDVFHSFDLATRNLFRQTNSSLFSIITTTTVIDLRTLDHRPCISMSFEQIESNNSAEIHDQSFQTVNRGSRLVSNESAMQYFLSFFPEDYSSFLFCISHSFF